MNGTETETKEKNVASDSHCCCGYAGHRTIKVGACAPSVYPVVQKSVLGTLREHNCARVQAGIEPEAGSLA